METPSTATDAITLSDFGANWVKIFLPAHIRHSLPILRNRRNLGKLHQTVPRKSCHAGSLYRKFADGEDGAGTNAME